MRERLTGALSGYEMVKGVVGLGLLNGTSSKFTDWSRYGSAMRRSARFILACSGRLW